MKPRYFKYYKWNSKKHFLWYRIKPDGTIEREYKKGKFTELRDGEFAKLLQDRIEEISEEDYFLMQL